jgi:hypothetical protein
MPPTWHAKYRSGFMTLPLALLLTLPVVLRCFKGLKLGSLLVRSHKVDTRIYVVQAAGA